MADEGGAGFCGVAAGGCDCGGEGTTLYEIISSNEYMGLLCSIGIAMSKKNVR